MSQLLYGWSGANEWLFRAINERPPSWIDSAMVAATQIGNYRYFPLYVVVWLLLIWHWRRAGAIESAQRTTLQVKRFVVGAICTLFLTALMKLGFDYPRPIAVLPWNDVRLLAGGWERQLHSLPSGHSAFIMLLALSVYPLVTWPYRVALFLVVICVGVSRVWLGEHFPADVVAGFGVGLIGALIGARLIRSVPHTGRMQEERSFEESKRVN